ncbi:MAG: putative GTP-binding protein EngB [Rhodomicrobium sp.]|nr:MAG: putative GTP-binding protein EngB [Rhodomicrobium sp.]
MLKATFHDCKYLMSANDKESASALLTPEAIAAGRALFRLPIEFIKGVVNEEGLPPADLPEIAFAGRSNVGKSSLINALTGQKGLARTSNTPGRTREINYFTIGEAAYLVDMPGYGYAKVPLSMVKQWTRLIENYLRGRLTLKRAYLLIDARHGVKKNDLEIMKQLDAAAALYQIVLTKTDKIKSGELKRRMEETEALIVKHPACYPLVIATSSSKGEGIDQLKAAISVALTS